MTRIQRRLLVQTSVIGVALTLLVAVLDASTRALGPLEDWFYDRRAQVCQVFTPPPSDKLVHVDIDDQAIVSMGQWPWPRTWMGELIDEIDRAGAKAIVLDILFSEPSNPSPRIEKVRPGQYVEVDDDANFAAAIRRSGKVLVPFSLVPGSAPSAVYHSTYEYLKQDLETSEADIYQRLLAEKVLPEGSAFPQDAFILARRHAMNTRIRDALKGGNPDVPALRARLLPKTDPNVTGSVLLRVLADEYRTVKAMAALDRFTFPPQPSLGPIAKYENELAPIAALSEAAAYSGFVDKVQTDDSGIVRTLPLCAELRGRLVPQMDLVAACAVLGVDVRSVRFQRSRVIIPKPPGHDRDVVIPVRTTYSPEFKRDVAMMMDVPARGRREWEYLYDHKRWKQPALHVPIAMVWEVNTTRERIARNNANIDKAISTILADDAQHKLALDPAKAKAYAQKLPEPHDTAARRALVEWTRGQLKESGLLALTKMSDADLKDDPQQKAQRDELILAERALSTLLDENERFESALRARRLFLKERIGGRAVYIGRTATGVLDQYPTATQPICPGVVIHAMAYNAIVSGEFWRHAPHWVTFLITVAIGLAVTAANGFLRPSMALGVAAALGVAYLVVNGLLLFDYENWCVGVAGPMVALVLVWSTGALAGFLIEAAERRAITRRFSSYVDKKLVDYILEKPDAKLDGQVREMTVVFADLAGFTSMAEQLRERTVPILSQYLSMMVPVIRRHEGFVNKFLGDGIMYFFNAPFDDPKHAQGAVAACLEMHKVLDKFALDLARQGLPRLSMRCGVSSGDMVVGDSGPQDASDYTVLGDNVNFAARLEVANKITGTATLISRRTVELLGDQFLVRPIGKLQVVGKREGVMTYEPLARADQATLDQRGLCEISDEIVVAYVAGNFSACIGVADRMDQKFGPTKLAALYRRASAQYLETPPGADFTGNLVITEK